MTKIIINADDFGYLPSVNYGIIDAYKNGPVSSTTIMANMPGFNHAVDLAKDNPGLAIGLHLTISTGQPLTKINQGFLDERGYFKRRSAYFNYEEESILVPWMNSLEVYREWKAQIDRALEAGLNISHLDSHHHIHFHRDFKPIAKKIAEEYKLDLRDENDKVDYFDRYFDEVISSKKMDYMLLEKRLGSLRSYEVVEIICHPAYLSKELLESSSFNIERMYELATLTDKRFKEILDKYNFEIVSYRDL